MRSNIIALTLFFCCSLLRADAQKPNDAQLSSLLVGTWETRDDEDLNRVVAESTFQADGSVRGFSLRVSDVPDGTSRTEEVKVRARWQVRNGSLYVTDYHTEPEGILPEGHSREYLIISVTSELAIFRDPKSETTLVRTRKRG